MQGRILDEDTAAQASELALAGARPLSRNAYKVVIAKVLVKRATQDILQTSNVRC